MHREGQNSDISDYITKSKSPHTLSISKYIPAYTAERNRIDRLKRRALQQITQKMKLSTKIVFSTTKENKKQTRHTE